MTKSRLAILLAAVCLSVSSQIAIAECNSNIPGGFKDRFTDNLDGTVTDNMTRLIWMKCDIDMEWEPNSNNCIVPPAQPGEIQGRKPLNWADTLMEVTNINAIGYSGQFDWRLPNVKELASILELNCLSISNTVALDIAFFPAPAQFLWSSTPHRGVVRINDEGEDINQAWKVTFRGTDNIGTRPENILENNNARLVRGFSN